MQTNTKKSWFKQFWPWFLIILPMAAVVAGILLLLLPRITNLKWWLMIIIKQVKQLMQT